mmetsp:Transcript_38228/g.74813  ORF Transcript_38228/g.74813 Transcript_38228/m.74813 type:complete len:144 (-) Transcript_38228:2082-2513(-)
MQAANLLSVIIHWRNPARQHKNIPRLLSFVSMSNDNAPNSITTCRRFAALAALHLLGTCWTLVLHPLVTVTKGKPAPEKVFVDENAWVKNSSVSVRLENSSVFVCHRPRAPYPSAADSAWCRFADERMSHLPNVSCAEAPPCS